MEQRVIKFRAWDEIYKKFMYSDVKGLRDFWSAVDGGLSAGRKVTVHEFTGLKDNNVNEIYEGDNVECFKNGLMIGAIDTIEFKNGCFWLKRRNISLYQWLNFDDENEYTFKVIGNIFETPELLNTNL